MPQISFSLYPSVYKHSTEKNAQYTYRSETNTDRQGGTLRNF